MTTAVLDALLDEIADRVAARLAKALPAAARTPFDQDHLPPGETRGAYLARAPRANLAVGQRGTHPAVAAPVACFMVSLTYNNRRDTACAIRYRIANLSPVGSEGRGSEEDAGMTTIKVGKATRAAVAAAEVAS